MLQLTGDCKAMNALALIQKKLKKEQKINELNYARWHTLLVIAASKQKAK